MIFFRLLAILLFVVSLVGAGTTTEGLAFLEQKKAEEGVIETASGLLYKEIRPGTGRIPLLNDYCSCHYSGSLINGVEFDSTYKHGNPLTFSPRQVISGWSEAMQMMREGAKWELYIKSELGYGDQGAAGVIPGGAVLIFELELLEIRSLI